MDIPVTDATDYNYLKMWIINVSFLMTISNVMFSEYIPVDILITQTKEHTPPD